MKRQRKCKSCGVKFTPTYNSLQPCCSIPCARDIARITREKNQKNEIEQKLKKLKVKTKKLSEYEREARKAFQAWIRWRDRDKPCVSCGANISNPCWDGGHLFKAELYSGLIFDEDNCSKQCRKCNYYRDGAEAEYRIGLVKRYGADFVSRLEERSATNRFKRYTREEYESIKKEYKNRLKYEQEKNRIADAGARIRHDFLSRELEKNRAIDREG